MGVKLSWGRKGGGGKVVLISGLFWGFCLFGFY